MKKNRKSFPGKGIGIITIITFMAIMSFAMPVQATGLVTQDLNSITQDDLAISLLGSGVTVNNIQYTGANIAAGKFSGGTGIIGIEQGIILSSGNIGNVVGPNIEDGITTVNGLPGDADLNSLIPGYTTSDASVLNMSFTPTGSVIVFEYVFASDEYNEYANSNYNDVFGFFLNGNNVAYLPGTDIVVSINTINNGSKPFGENSQNPEYYINNDISDGGGMLDTEMDGLTTVLTVTANVVPHQENTIKIAIADSGDSHLDSNVFIEGGSFSSPQLTLIPLSATNFVGSEHTLTASFVDSNGAALVGKHVTFTITGLGGGTGAGITNGNGVATFTYTGTIPGIHKIVATSEDQTSNDVYMTWEPSLNQPPVVEAGADATINEGSSFSSSGSFIDPDTDTWTATVDYGNGPESLTLTGKDFSLSHIYPDNGDYIVTVNVSDNNGAIGTDTATVTVNNVAPVVEAVTVPVEPQSIDTNIIVTSIFSDVGVLDTHTAEIDFGDGTTSIGVVAEVNGSGTVTSNHIYASAGIYTVTVTVLDDDGGKDIVTANKSIVIYDPTGGFVTGGGWIDSPLGAYVADPTLTGKASFGFVSKYQKGATKPSGNTEFQFRAGNLNFHSSSYDWLVIAGQKAIYKGIGQINGGTEQYKFMISAKDNNTEDTFRIKITDTSDNIVYDNQMAGNIDDNVNPTLLINGGNIVVHKGK
ncbi:PKD domain-containing protein [Candidatus Parcubacteria bacterium]|nr:PKD domain-containing protein [Candidatus Parcubacteria bacterium]